MTESGSTTRRVRELVEGGEVSAACDLLYASYAPDVRRFVASLRPAIPVQDLCQETWVAALAGLPRFRFEASPRVWLFSIARRRTIDALRRNRKRDLETRLETTEVLLKQLAVGRARATPSSALVRKRRAAVLDRVLADWSPDDRELLELRFVAGLKPAEIVDVLAHPQNPNTVSQRLVRLASRLRSQLRHHDEFAAG
jgi:RNA polymerase sigma-70 factor (ECF subfamily)